MKYLSILFHGIDEYKYLHVWLFGKGKTHTSSETDEYKIEIDFIRVFGIFIQQTNFIYFRADK